MHPPSAFVGTVVAMVSPDYVVQLLTAIGTGLAALIGAVGYTVIKLGKQRDEANRESTLAKLDESEKQRRRDSEAAKVERAAQARRIEELTKQVAELNHIILIEGGFFKRPTDGR